MHILELPFHSARVPPRVAQTREVECFWCKYPLFCAATGAPASEIASELPGLRTPERKGPATKHQEVPAQGNGTPTIDAEGYVLENSYVFEVLRLICK